MRVYLSKMFCSVAGRLLCSSWLLMLRLPLFAALVFEAGASQRLAAFGVGVTGAAMAEVASEPVGTSPSRAPN